MQGFRVSGLGVRLRGSDFWFGGLVQDFGFQVQGLVWGLRFKA